MADRQSVEAIQWLAYIGRTRYDLICAANGWEIRLAGLPNLNVDVYSASRNEVFEYLGCFWHGCHAFPIATSPLVTTVTHCC